MQRLSPSCSICRLFLFATLVTAAAIAADDDPARIGAGVRVGGNTAGWFQNVFGRESTSVENRALTLGPFVELRFTDFFAVEAGALYRGIERNSAGGYPGLSSFSEQESGSAWEFPVLGKYRFPARLGTFRPFAAAGPVFYLLRTTERFQRSYLGTGPDGRPAWIQSAGTTDFRQSHTGFALGGGLEKAAGRARLSFEGRLSLWPGQTVSPGDPTGCYIRCRQSPQFSILGGLSF